MSENPEDEAERHITPDGENPIVSYRGNRYSNSEATQICGQYIDKGDYSPIMQDDEILATQINTH